MMTRIVRATSSAFACAALLLSTPSRAQTAADKATAQALFDEGRKLLQDGRFADACPKFVASQRLDPGLGTKLNLADCYEKNGQVASAWAEFREAADQARAAGEKKREEIARTRAAALEASLPRLVVVVAAEALVEGLAVRRDGTAVDRAVWGTKLPVDPGRITVAASAPGRKSWSTTIQIAKGATATVDVPKLVEDAPAAAGAPIAAPAPAPAPAPAVQSGASAAPAEPPRSSPPASDATSGPSRRTIGLAVGGVGVAALGVGTVFAILASSADQASSDHCRADNHCDREGVDLRDTALGRATVSTVAFVVGGVGVAAGAVLFLTAPKAPAVAVIPVAGPGVAYADVKVRFW